MKKNLIVVAVLTSLTSFGAFAEATNDFYAGAEVGYSKVDNVSQSVANSLVNAVGGAVAVTQDSGVAIGRAFVGYTINENVSAEVGLTKTSDISLKAAGVSGNGTAYTANANQSLYGIDYSVLLRPSVSTGLNGLFVRAGGHYDKAEYNGSVTGVGGTAAVNYSKTGGGFLVGAGYDYAVSPSFNVRASYNYYDSIAGNNGNANVFSIGAIAKF